MTYDDGFYNEISEFDLQALIDGELDEQKRRRLMDAIMESPEDMERLESLVRQKEQLKAWSKLFLKDN